MYINRETDKRKEWQIFLSKKTGGSFKSMAFENMIITFADHTKMEDIANTSKDSYKINQYQRFNFKSQQVKFYCKYKSYI